MNQEKQKALQSLKTARGQIEGIIKMIEEERYCMDVSNQIVAAQALLKRSQILILKQHLSNCVKTALQENNWEEKNDELMKVIEKIIN